MLSDGAHATLLPTAYVSHVNPGGAAASARVITDQEEAELLKGAKKATRRISGDKKGADSGDKGGASAPSAGANESPVNFGDQVVRINGVSMVGRTFDDIVTHARFVFLFCGIGHVESIMETLVCLLHLRIWVFCASQSFCISPLPALSPTPSPSLRNRKSARKNEAVLELVPQKTIYEVHIPRQNLAERLGMTVTGTLITAIEPDGPADNAGVTLGHHILSVNGQSVVDMRQEQVVELLREGNPVVLTTIPEHLYQSIAAQFV